MFKKMFLISIVLLVLLCAGCPAVQMRPNHERVFRLTTINVAELNRRCQEGDNQACKEGLDLAAQAMQTAVLAMDGKAGE